MKEIQDSELFCPSKCNNNGICSANFQCECGANQSFKGRDCSKQIQVNPYEIKYYEFDLSEPIIELAIQKQNENDNIDLLLDLEVYKNPSNDLPYQTNNEVQIQQNSIYKVQFKNINQNLDLGLKIKIQSFQNYSQHITLNIKQSNVESSNNDNSDDQKEDDKENLVLYIILISAIVVTFILVVGLGFYIIKDYQKHRSRIQRIHNIQNKKIQKQKDIEEFIPCKQYSELIEELKQNQQNQFKLNKINKISSLANLNTGKQNQQQIFSLNSRNFNEIMEEKSCPICLLSFEQTDQVRMTVCDHIFHKECIDDWYQKQQVCPSCRQELTKKGIDVRKDLNSQRFIKLNQSQIDQIQNEQNDNKDTQNNNLNDQLQNLDFSIENKIDINNQEFKQDTFNQNSEQTPSNNLIRQSNLITRYDTQSNSNVPYQNKQINYNTEQSVNNFNNNNIINSDNDNNDNINNLFANQIKIDQSLNSPSNNQVQQSNINHSQNQLNSPTLSNNMFKSRNNYKSNQVYDLEQRDVIISNNSSSINANESKNIDINNQQNIQISSQNSKKSLFSMKQQRSSQIKNKEQKQFKIQVLEQENQQEN